MSTDDVARVARRAGARDVARSVTRTARCAVELVERAATLRGVRRRHGATTAGERAHGDEARAIARARGHPPGQGQGVEGLRAGSRLVVRARWMGRGIPRSRARNRRARAGISIGGGRGRVMMIFRNGKS